MKEDVLLEIKDKKNFSMMTLQSVKNGKKFFIRAVDRSECIDFELTKKQVKQLKDICNNHLEESK